MKFGSKELRVRMSFGRATGGGRDEWRLSITDVDSGAQVLEARLSDEEYALLHANRDLPLDRPVRLNVGEHLGMVHEFTHLDLTGVKAGASSAQILTLATGQMTAEMRADGWEPIEHEYRSGYNQHRRNPDDTYRMAYGRYVERDDT